MVPVSSVPDQSKVSRVFVFRDRDSRARFVERSYVLSVFTDKACVIAGGRIAARGDQPSRFPPCVTVRNVDVRFSFSETCGDCELQACKQRDCEFKFHPAHDPILPYMTLQVYATVRSRLLID